MWTAILSLLTGPIISGFFDSYKAKLAAENTRERTAADLAQRELEVQKTELQAQNALKIAQIGHWYEPEKLFAYSLWIFFTKVYLWDAAFHMGTSDAVKGDVALWGALVISFYFGKRTIENAIRIFKQ